MEAPINFEDFHQQLAFGFWNAKMFRFEPLEPQIGSFSLSSSTLSEASATTAVLFTSKNVDFVKLPEADSKVMAKVLKSYGSKADLKSMYTVRNSSML